MSKRRLSKRQADRIRKSRASDNGLDQDLSELKALQEGLIISRFGNQADVESLEGEIQRCMFRSHLGSIVAGDKVKWRAGKEKGIVESLLPRKSELIRPDSFGNIKVVAANIDVLLITIAIKPEPHYNLIDRYLVAASNLNLKPFIIINKCDLINDDNRHIIDEIDAYYAPIDLPILPVSAKTKAGFDNLKTLLKDKISAFVGQSGVGKSSMLQTLLPHEDIKIGKLSEQIEKGKHTTTNAKLYHFEEGGNCIDSPGIREFGLWHLTPEEVLKGFPDLAEYSGRCKFRNCSHTNEPGCELLAAINNKKISPVRFESYQRIVQSLGEVSIKTKNRDG